MIFARLLIAGLVGAWVFWDSRKRGAELPSASLWALGALVLGAIGPVLLAVFLPLYLFFGRKATVEKSRRQEVIDVEAIPIEDAIYCPMCGGKAKDDYVVCPHCAHTLKPKCPECGKALDRTWKVCPFCQTPATQK